MLLYYILHCSCFVFKIRQHIKKIWISPYDFQTEITHFVSQEWLDNPKLKINKLWGSRAQGQFGAHINSFVVAIVLL